MVSPNLIKNIEKKESLEVNENTKKLFQVVYTEKNKKDKKDDSPKIRVSSLVSRLAFVYEKARNAVDYEEEHLLRKTAISRILKRQVIIEGVVRQAEAKNIAEHLLTELIRGGYLPNDSIPESKIQETALILEKYIRLKNKISAEANYSLNLKTDINAVKDSIKEKNSLVSWFLTLAACEIEEGLAPNNVKKSIVGNMFELLSKNIKLPIDLKMYEKDLPIQIYLSISRRFSRFDDDLLSFVLFKYYNSFWADINKDDVLSPDEENKIDDLASKIEDIKKTIEKDLKHPLKKQLDKVSRLYSLYYTVLTETIDTDPAKIYGELQNNQKGFFAAIVKTCNQKYTKAKSKLWRSAVRSILYIFLTKSVFVFAIEVPAIRWFNEPLNIMSLVINIAFPAVLLFFIVLTTKKPEDSNTQKIVEGVKEIISPDKSSLAKSIILRKPQKRKFLPSLIFNIIYTASFFVSIYAITRVLSLVNFTWVSIVIFLFFLAFVSFFSIITTKGVKELLIIEKRESLLSFLLDLFYLPIILVGRWLSNNMSKVNIFVFIFDFIIEAPFKILIEIAEDWTKYVKEKGENIE